MNALPKYVSVHHMWIRCLCCLEKEGIGIPPGIGVRDGYESPHRGREPSLGTLQEQQELLCAEPAL